MSWLSWLSSGSNSAEKVVDAAIATGDALFFTEEEKSVANMKKLDWILAYMKTTSGQNLARRLIAVGVVGLWIIMVLVAVITGYFDRGEGSYSEWVFSIIKDAVKEPFMIIIGFYFLTSALRAFKGGG